ncbi:TorD/DmsD family molecular chaperone [Fulvimarina pelagi]|uniref:TorD/DmsD family molecular chaperone n=1 Tax=Fulvimarina pelagi TaxID=217511 RepID=UPI0002F81B91|nr:molecular chaperone TorD family protein [Fulvimarina pelagi]
MHTQNAAVSQLLDEADHLRVNLYRMLAGLLARSPDQGVLTSLSSLSGDETELGQAIGDLSKCAVEMTAEDVSDEYIRLFIGVGRGELVPFGSYYLTGFLHEKPLARLRSAMAPLGIERAPEVKEPEDHAAALMDMMAGLIDGSFGERQPLHVQRDFFREHVGSWIGHFYRDLAAAKGARFYAPVGRIGALFTEIEDAGFDM